MKFSIITPCFNAEKYIKETMVSVLSQTAVLEGKVGLEYILFDGGSDDNTLKIINSFSSKKNNITIKVFSEKDNGMYDALSKGLKISTGDIQAYINAGDLYNLNAFALVNEIFSNNSGANWLTGSKFIYNDKSIIIKHTVPYNYKKNLIQAGVYGRFLPFIQQESTFWRSKLNNYINHEKLKALKLAGDYFLWVTFSEHAKLEIIQSHLGGFKIHPGQLSSTINNLGMNYIKEMSTFVKKISIKIIFDIIKEIIPWTILKYSNNFFGSINNHYTFSKSGEWVTGDKDIIYCWGCDLATTSGEGQLLYKFVSENLRNNQKIIIRNTKAKIVLKKDFDLKQINNTSNKLKLNFYDSYMTPYIGILYLWYRYILGNKVCYINFLPLWNIFLFILLPPGTKLGPISGSYYKGRVFNFESFLRKYITPILYKISNFFLHWRKQNLIFNTDILTEFLSPKIQAKSKFNYIFNNIQINLYNKFKDIDLLIYNRNYFNKSNFFFEKVITKLQEDNFKVYYFGDKINAKLNNYKKIIENKKVNEYLNRSKFTIISSENFYSFYCLEAIQNNVNLFYDNNFKPKIEFVKHSKKIKPLNFSGPTEAIDMIKEEIINFDKYNYPYSTNIKI
jgi:glycosyltransferase involved in cell wall biosynthesis